MTMSSTPYTFAAEEDECGPSFVRGFRKDAGVGTYMLPGVITA